MELNIFHHRAFFFVFWILSFQTHFQVIPLYTQCNPDEKDFRICCSCVSSITVNLFIDEPRSNLNYFHCVQLHQMVLLYYTWHDFSPCHFKIRLLLRSVPISLHEMVSSMVQGWTAPYDPIENQTTIHRQLNSLVSWTILLWTVCGTMFN